MSNILRLSLASNTQQTKTKQQTRIEIPPWHLFEAVGGRNRVNYTNMPTWYA